MLDNKGFDLWADGYDKSGEYTCMITRDEWENLKYE